MTSRPFEMFRLAGLAFGLLAAAAFTTDALAQAKTKKPEAKAATVLAIPPPGPAEVPLFGPREFSDSRSGLEMTMPAGWLAIEIPRVPKDALSLVLIEGPGSPAPSCRLGVRAPKQPPKITQVQINKIMHDGRNLTMIKNNLAKDGREVVAINKLNIKGISGVQAQVLMPGNDRRPDVTLLVNFFESVGRAYSFECTILSADYANMSGSIDALIKSLRFTNS